MIGTGYVKQMADYNQWMNARLYEMAARLTEEELTADRGAFFGSLLGTLHHIVNGDTGWLKRFANSPARTRSLEPVRAFDGPNTLDEIRFGNLSDLSERRSLIDRVIIEWASELHEGDLQLTVTYRNMKDEPHSKRLGDLLMHFFNHQTHHRGQATTLLMQAGIDPGVTDLLALLPERS